jgi:hypothetical protein
MPKARTWLFIIFGTFGVLVLAMLVMAGLGTMWVLKHVNTQPATSAAATKTFETERAQFKDKTPLFKFEDLERLDRSNNADAIMRKISALPTSPVKPTDLAILAWDPDDERTVRVSIPFWALRFGGKKARFSNGGFDFDSLRLDVGELERIGPTLLIDIQRPGGERVLVWTK